MAYGLVVSRPFASLPQQPRHCADENERVLSNIDNTPPLSHDLRDWTVEATSERSFPIGEAVRMPAHYRLLSRVASICGPGCLRVSGAVAPSAPITTLNSIGLFHRRQRLKGKGSEGQGFVKPLPLFPCIWPCAPTRKMLQHLPSPKPAATASAYHDTATDQFPPVNRQAVPHSGSMRFCIRRLGVQMLSVEVW